MTIDVYKKRQEEKELRDKYRERAKAIVGNNAKIPSHGNIQMMEDGAFVEATIWVPKEKL